MLNKYCFSFLESDSNETKAFIDSYLPIIFFPSWYRLLFKVISFIACSFSKKPRPFSFKEKNNLESSDDSAEYSIAKMFLSFEQI